MDKALLIRESGVWDLCAIELCGIIREGDAYRKGAPITDGGSDRDLRRMVEYCEWTTPERLYQKGGRRFKSMRDFLDGADKSLKKYLTEQVGRHVVEAVTLATRLCIPIWMVSANRQPLEESRRLRLAVAPLSLHPHFVKRADGVDYRLTVGDGIALKCHRVRILSNRPALVAVDHVLYQLSDGLNGALLKPFLDKETTFIPKRLQDDYFRRFVLRIAALNEIQAEGFEVREVRPQGRLRLELMPAVGGGYCLTPTFDYDGNSFTPQDSHDRRVTLHDDGQSVFFASVCRDREWERRLLEKLSLEMGMPGWGRLPQLARWLSAHQALFAGQRVEVCQRTSHRYYIGDVRLEQSLREKSDWFEVDVKLCFPTGQKIPMSALRDHLLHGTPEYQLPNGEWFVIPDEWFARYSSLLQFGRMHGNGTLTLHRSQSALLQKLPGKSSHPALLDAVPSVPPPTLRATLRPYQQAGYEWLCAHWRAGQGCCLGDDMGLGKTVQAIALIATYVDGTTPAAELASEADFYHGHAQLSIFTEAEMRNSKPKRQPVLVVAPASVAWNWRAEFRRFAPTLRVLNYQGVQQTRRRKMKMIANADVVITTYQTLRNDICPLSRYHYAIAVWDEAQAFKNRFSQVYDAVAKVRADFHLALTGTPMENSLDELWAIMSILTPQLLGDYLDFDRNFIHPIAQDLESKQTEMLRQLIEPNFLRRLKGDVLQDLPDRQDETVRCPMSPRQLHLYREEESRMRNLIFSADAIFDNIHILSAITRLRQIACSPALVDTSYADGAAESLMSGKMEELFARLEALRPAVADGLGLRHLSTPPHKALLFSNYVGFLQLIAHEMERRGWGYAMLTGETRDCEAVVRHFQEAEDCQFFLVTLKAGGVGLNLTCADYVFLLDPWWNTAAEEQAISRAHRFGQRRSVFVYRMVSEGTLEEKMLHVQDRKQSMIDAVLAMVK